MVKQSMTSYTQLELQVFYANVAQNFVFRIKAENQEFKGDPWTGADVLHKYNRIHGDLISHHIVDLKYSNIWEII